MTFASSPRRKSKRRSTGGAVITGGARSPLPDQGSGSASVPARRGVLASRASESPMSGEGLALAGAALSGLAREPFQYGQEPERILVKIDCHAQSALVSRNRS